jgi:hypothetical protein
VISITGKVSWTKSPNKEKRGEEKGKNTSETGAL